MSKEIIFKSYDASGQVPTNLRPGEPFWNSNTQILYIGSAAVNANGYANAVLVVGSANAAALQATVATLQATTNAISANVATITTSIAAYANLVANVALIANLQTQVNALSVSVDTVNTSVTTLTSNLTALQITVNNNSTSITAINANIASLSTMTGTLAANVGTLFTIASNNAVSIANITTNLNTLANTVASINATGNTVVVTGNSYLTLTSNVYTLANGSLVIHDGPLTVNSTITVNGTGSGTIAINKTGANFANILGESGSVARWNLILGDNTSEVGSNIGSNFSLVNYSDTGNVLSTPIYITRNNNFVGINNIYTPSSALHVGGDVRVDRGNGTGALYFGNTASHYLYYDGTNHNFVGGQLWVTANNSAAFILNKANTTQYNTIRGAINGSPRWDIVMGDNTAESGSNTGSVFYINRYDNTGAYLGSPLTILRNNGYVGIGLFAPTSKLHVSGDVTIANSANIGVIQFGTTGTKTLSLYDGTNFSLTGPLFVTGSLTTFGTLNANNDINTNGDIHAARLAAPTTGAIFLGNSGARYLYYDGGNYQMPGASVISAGFQSVAAYPSLTLNKNAVGTEALIVGQRNSLSRWSLSLGNATAEAGSSSGSDFYLNTFNDAGNYTHTPIYIRRDTGYIGINGNVSPQAPLDINGVTQINGDSSGGWLQVNKTTNGTGANILGMKSGVWRWAIIPGNAAAESGSDTGSDFQIANYHDDGSYIGSPIIIQRNTGNILLGSSLYRNNSKINPWINVKTDFGAVGNGSTDDTAAINNAITYVNSNGGVLYFPAGTYRVGNLTAFSREGGMILGDGRDNTIIATYATSGTTLNITNCGRVTIKGFTFQPTSNKSSGFELGLSGLFRYYVQDLAFIFPYNGIQIYNCTGGEVYSIEGRFVLGDYFIYANGTNAGGRVNRVTIQRAQGDCPMPVQGHSPSTNRNYAGSTAYSVGQTVDVNGWIWQCSTAGTTGGGTSPSYNPGIALGTQLFTGTSDGSVVWKAAFKSNMTWLYVDSCADSFVIFDSAFIDGGYGIQQVDNTAGSFTAPNWIWSWDLELDHNYHNSVVLNNGLGFNATTGYFSSTCTGDGIYIAGTYQGQVNIKNSYIFGNAGHGITVLAGPIDIMIDSNQIGANGQKTPNTYHGINIGPNVTKFNIQNNSVGSVNNQGNGSQYAGILVNSGSSNQYIITGNRTQDNATIGLSDNGSGGSKVVANNI